MSPSFVIRRKLHGIARPLVLLAVTTWGGVFIALSLVVVVLFSDEVFPVRDIEINGKLRQLHPEVIRAVAEQYIQRGFFMSDIDGLQQELLRDPWTHDVLIRRKWPDKISIQIVEELAFARWQDRGFLSYSGDFFLLTDVDVLHRNLPVMSGPEDSHKEVFNKYRQISEVLAPLGLHLSELHLSDRNSWRFKLDNGWLVRLGREPIQLNLQRFVSVVHDVLAGRSFEVDAIDMRYANGYAVLWKKQSATDSDLTVMEF